ncbi:MAG: MFS transporter [Chloroflexota bacterium]|nr:MFS transporter [Chloroflexota bacterium]
MRNARGSLYYGWVLVLTLGVTETISWGVLYYAFADYLAPMQAEFGWSRGEMTGAFSVALLVAGVAAIPVGRWLDGHGPRVLMTLGSIAATGLVLAWSRAGGIQQFYLVWAAIGLTMSATLYDPAFATVTRWFERDRVRALTAITLMAGFASTIFIPLASWLVQIQGWRTSLVTLALILAIGTIAPHALLLRRRPEDVGLRADGGPSNDRPPANPELHGSTAAADSLHGMAVGQALRQASFWWLALAFWLSTLATIAVSLHLLPYLQDRGYDATFAASVTGLVGAMQVAARFILAPLSHRGVLRPRVLAAATLAMQPAALLVLLLVRSTLGVFVFVVLFGAHRGLSTLARPALLADLYGVARYASIAGVLQFAISLAQAAAPVGAGAAYDWLASYEPILWTLTLTSALAVVAVLPARPSPGSG